jgi:ribose 5-phosphate isomerase A
MTNVDAALALVADGMTVGLGSGSASERFLRALGDRVRSGLRVRGVPTSDAIAALAAQVGVPLVGLADALPLDLTVDGADEVDPHLNLIKGYGRALVREKIVAAASKRLVILIGPGKVAEKRVNVLGRRGKLPVEVVPFAVPLVRRELDRLGIPGDVLTDAGKPVVSDNGNHILHARVGPIADPAGLDAKLCSIPGVVGTGLFVGMADVVLAEDCGRVEELRRGS